MVWAISFATLDRGCPGSLERFRAVKVSSLVQDAIWRAAVLRGCCSGAFCDAAADAGLAATLTLGLLLRRGGWIVSRSFLGVAAMLACVVCSRGVRWMSVPRVTKLMYSKPATLWAVARIARLVHASAAVLAHTPMY